MNEEFRLLLDQNDAWPTLKALLQGVKRHGGGRRADLVDMKAGATVPEKYLVALIELLEAKRGLNGFAAVDGGDGKQGTVLDQIAGPVEPQARIATDGEDWLMKGLEGLVGLFTDYVWSALIRPGTLCAHEKDVHTAVQLIMTDVGRQIAHNPLLDSNEAIKAAERFMQVSFEAYRARAVESWVVTPWSIIFGVIARQRVACTYVLPLREVAYHQLRGGERNVHSFGATDLVVPSKTLFLEAASHRSDAEYASTAKKTIQSARSLFTQIAALTLDANVPAADFRLMAMAGNRTNGQRLHNMGFRPVGTRMYGFNIALMEMDEKKAWFIPLVVQKLRDRLKESTLA